MIYNDAMWSYAEDFTNKLCYSFSDSVIEDNNSVLEEISEVMNCELKKKDRRNVLDKMDTIMSIRIDENEIKESQWNRIRTALSSLV